MPNAELLLRFRPCLPGYDRGPPRTFRLGLLSAVWHPNGQEERHQRELQAVRTAANAELQARELRTNAVLAAAMDSISQLSCPPPGAANAAGQQDSAPGGVVPSARPPGSPQLDAAPGGGPHFGKTR